MAKNNLQENDSNESYCVILNEFNSWISYIQGFLKGIESSKEVKIDSITVCINEVLQGMYKNKARFELILKHCNNILVNEEKKENAYKSEINKLTNELDELKADNLLLTQMNRKI